MKAAQAILKKARKHVEKYGLDGGHYPLRAENVEERMCPRGLVMVYADEIGRDAFTLPSKPSALKALEALDQASGLVQFESNDYQGYLVGSRAERFAWALAEEPSETQLAYIDEAIALA